jgi:hypothetical protein
MNKNIQVFDNGGKTVDRYCLIVDNRKVYTLSADPSDPLGVRYLCDAIDLDRTEAGRSLQITDLPKTIAKVIGHTERWLRKEAA